MESWKWTIGLGATSLLVLVAGASAAAPKAGASAQVRRGEYLVTVSGCNDCHTPWKMGPNGPEPDRARLLSGHPQELVVTEAPRPAGGPWIVAGTGTMTAWSGPWGVSFAANLTPDPETGLGKWTAQNFSEALRTGRHMGRGRPILPPMPWPNAARLTDEDLRAMFAYLQSIPPIQNRVPEPLPPAVAADAQPTGGAPAPAPASR